MEYTTSRAYRRPTSLLREKKPEREPIPERLLANLWRKRAARQEGFRTGSGVRFRVIYPGHSGGGAGPDFRDALLEVEGVGLVRGDVEIHLRQRDWDNHGHGQDRNYNGVVLHAALDVDSPATVLQSGQQTPVVSLKPLLEGGDPPDTGPNSSLWARLDRHGYHQPNSPNEMGVLLDRAGDQRFIARSAWFQSLVLEQGPDQTLYEGLLEALGYRFNQQPFLKLAQRAPYAALLRAAGSVPREQLAQSLESWLVLLSGFPPLIHGLKLPSPRVGFGPALSVGEWHCFRVRPPNHPRRRIAGAAVLLDRFLEVGLVQSLTQAAVTDRPKELTSALTVEADPNSKEALIGQSRARDLAVNVVLPSLDGLATLRDDFGAGEVYRGQYQRFSKLQENRLTREMADQLMDLTWTGVVTNARRQQGLLHLHALLMG